MQWMYYLPREFMLSWVRAWERFFAFQKKSPIFSKNNFSHCPWEDFYLFLGIRQCFKCSVLLETWSPKGHVYVGKDLCILAPNFRNHKIFIEYLSDTICFLGVVGLLIEVGAQKTNICRCPWLELYFDFSAASHTADHPSGGLFSGLLLLQGPCFPPTPQATPCSPLLALLSIVIPYIVFLRAP